MSSHCASSTLQPIAPTANLPPVARLSSYSTERVAQAMANLRKIYTSYSLPALSYSTLRLPEHAIHDVSVPDSGYASAEEDEDEDNRENASNEEINIDVLRSDAFEREYAIRWLTAFTARSDTWVYNSGIPEDEDARAQLVDDAASLLASFAGDDDEEESITRTFSFSVYDDNGLKTGNVEVMLNDAPLLSQDHTSVGLQSWGSSIVLAERMCADPLMFGLLPARLLRVLELGAGTGMLSIAAAKLWPKGRAQMEIVATDYHHQVLDNLRTNVDSNLPSSSSVIVMPLDWQFPKYVAPFDQAFDVILAADVIYHPEHARWIKSCVETLLRRPSTPRPGHNDIAQGSGTFWLIIPVRSTGRHEGMADTVETVFRSEVAIKAAGNAAMELGILSMDGMEKHNGIGRADESCYRLFKIGWVEP
jgi:protein-lysine N-methyltransferase EEF2KMT